MILHKKIPTAILFPEYYLIQIQFQTVHKLNSIFVNFHNSILKPVDQFTITLFQKKAAYSKAGGITMVTKTNSGHVVMVTERIST